MKLSVYLGWTHFSFNLITDPPRQHEAVARPKDTPTQANAVWHYVDMDAVARRTDATSQPFRHCPPSSFDAVARRTDAPSQRPVRYGGYIAGFRFYDGPRLVDRLRRGAVLRLVRDRHNRHDTNAIQIMIGRHMLGFVPRGPNVEIARRIDQAEPIVCRIVQVNADEKPWKKVEICVESLSIATPWWAESELDDDTAGPRNERDEFIYVRL